MQTEDRQLKATVVLPTHNRPVLLAEALQSVLDQEMRPCEVIIVDDASEPPVSRELAADAPMKIRLERNATSQGGAAAKERGTAAAAGDVVFYLDDDDRFHPTLIRRAMDVLGRHPSLDVLFLGVDWFGGDVSELSEQHEESVKAVLEASEATEVETNVWLLGPNLLVGLLKTIPMQFQRPVVRRTAVARIGYHRRDCLLWDCDWALRAALCCKCGLLNVPVYQQRSSGQGYFSRPGRKLAQLHSLCEIHYRLYVEFAKCVPPTQARLLRSIAAETMASLSYHYANEGLLTKSIASWLRSQQIHPDPSKWRTPIRALLRALRVV